MKWLFPLLGVILLLPILFFNEGLGIGLYMAFIGMPIGMFCLVAPWIADKGAQDGFPPAGG